MRKPFFDYLFHPAPIVFAVILGFQVLIALYGASVNIKSLFIFIPFIILWVYYSLTVIRLDYQDYQRK